MFGYVKPVVGELLVKEHEFYKATYCGICQSMRRHTGLGSTVTLTYDSVFLALMRMAYMDDGLLSSSMRRCAVHPLRKKCMLDENPALVYTARAFAILTYYKTLDDMSDEGLMKRMGVGLVRPIAGGARRRASMERLDQAVREKLAAIDRLEKAACPYVDEPATLFGELLGEVFSEELEGDGRLVMSRVGYHLGRFIYAIDAADDYDEDVRHGRYNPYVLSYGGAPLTDENRQTVRRALMLECRQLESAVDLVPFGRKVTVENIVRNIIYSGLVKRMELLDGASMPPKA